MCEHQLNMAFQADAATTAQRRAEHAGVYDDLHSWTAAAKASSSSSVRPSISSTSTDGIVGAESPHPPPPAATCNEVAGGGAPEGAGQGATGGPCPGLMRLRGRFRLRGLVG